MFAVEKSVLDRLQIGIYWRFKSSLAQFLPDVTVYFHGSVLLWNTEVFECALVNNIQE